MLAMSHYGYGNGLANETSSGVRRRETRDEITAVEYFWERLQDMFHEFEQAKNLLLWNNFINAVRPTMKKIIF